MLHGLIVLAGLIALALQLGADAIADALTKLTAPTVLLALGLGAVATASSALRWRAVGHAVGVTVSLGAAWTGIYRATLLNSVLPGGFLGDAARAVAAHRAETEPHASQRAARVVVLERGAGQATVLAAALAVVAITLPGLTATVLDTVLVAPPLAAPLGAGPDAPAAATTAGTATAAASIAPADAGEVAGPTAAVLAVAVLVIGALVFAVGGPAITSRERTGALRARCSRWTQAAARQLAVVGGELRRTLGWRTAAVIVLTSLTGFGALLATFALAAHVVAAPIPLSQLLPLCTVGLIAMALPINVGGWGPREAATAAAFALAGHAATTGLALSVVYGVLTLLGCLPGLPLLARQPNRPITGRDKTASRRRPPRPRTL